MKTILFEELKPIKKHFSSGNFSRVDIVKYNNTAYCFKIFVPYNVYPSDIIKNIGNLTEINFSDEYITPEYLVIRKNRIIGYLSEYKKSKTFAKTDLDLERKIELLTKMKELIIKLHKEYKIIHGDLNLTNFLYDNNLNVSLIDFDSALKFGQKTRNSKLTMQDSTLNYLKYIGYDYKADIYKFNFETLKFLFDIPTDEIVLSMATYELFDYNSSVNELSRELILTPRSKKCGYSGEFIIDYID